tara:strand:- start:92261 stop:92968 length:708 start_codon:yes stop_codon:yes gene_type:complete
MAALSIIQLLFFSLFAGEVLCPKGYLPLNYTSPITGKEVQTCTTRINGKVIQQKPLKKSETKKDLKKIVMNASTQIFMSLVNKSQNKDLGSFSTRNCQGSRQEWGRFLLGQQKSIAISYIFAKGCSLKGSYKPKIRQEFPLKFQVRDIPAVQKVDMSLIVDPSLDLKNKMMNTLFTVKNMKINGPQLNAVIRAKYKVAYGIKGTIVKNYGGEIEILSVNGETLNIIEKVYIPIDE